MSNEFNSIITNRNRDCLLCRIVSGGGLLGAGFYVGFQSKKFRRSIGKSIMFGISGALMILGTLRVLDLPPFKNQSQSKK